MSGGSPDNRNKQRGLLWRSRVLEFLREVLPEAVARRETPTKLSEAILLVQERGDIHGLPGWTLMTSCAASPNWGGLLDEAERARVIDRKTHAAVAFFRKGAFVEESYVLMRLETFRNVVAAERETVER